jgi:hypothetical protein
MVLWPNVFEIKGKMRKSPVSLGKTEAIQLDEQYQKFVS